MTVGSVLLGVALLVVVGVVVMRPFLTRHLQREKIVGRREALQAQKEAVLERIRELDFDNETGKVPDEEYESQRRQLLAEAAGILERLDALAPAATASGNGSEDVEDEVEAAISRLRKAPSTSAGSADEIEAAVRQLRRQPAVANGPQSPETISEGSGGGDAGNFCSQCGRPRDADDKFCAYCGHQFS